MMQYIILVTLINHVVPCGMVMKAFLTIVYYVTSYNCSLSLYK